MGRIDIPGGWAELAEPDSLSTRQERTLRKAYLPVGKAAAENPTAFNDEEVTPERAKAIAQIGQDTVDSIDDLQDVTIHTFLRAWSLDDPIPILEAIPDLPRPVFDAIALACNPLVIQVLQPATFGPDGAADPNSPTGPSAA